MFHINLLPPHELAYFTPELLVTVWAMLLLLGDAFFDFTPRQTANLALAGLGVALVVILHKPFDAMAVSTLMAASGSSKMSRHVLNGLFALASPLGAVLFYFGANLLSGGSAPVLGGALAFCAGSFLCIASSDLLPELQFHSHDRFKLSAALLAGLAVAVIIGMVETG